MIRWLISGHAVIPAGVHASVLCYTEMEVRWITQFMEGHMQMLACVPNPIHTHVQRRTQVDHEQQSQGRGPPKPG